MPAGPIRLLAVTAVVVAACSTPTHEELVTGEALFPPGAATTAFSESLRRDDGIWRGLVQAGAQLGVVEAGSPLAAAAQGPPVLAPEQAESPVLRKLVSAQLAALAVTSAGPGAAGAAGLEKDFSISHGELEEFGRMLVDSLGIPGSGDAVAVSRFSAAGGSSSAWRRAQQYLAAYFAGEFVDRSGTKLSKPEITSNVGNDTITAFLTVSLEALYDSMYALPVFTADGKPLTATGLVPTAAILDPELLTPVAPDAPVTENEARAIRFLSDVAADQSEFVSGLVVRAFADLELSFVVGGHVSFGDNETLAKISDLLFAISSRRVTETVVLRAFRAQNGEGHHLAGLLDLLEELYDALESSG